MAKIINVKCKYCKAEIDKTKAYNPSPKVYYCSEEHYQLYQKSKENKKSNAKSKYKQPNEMKEYTDYIQSLYLWRGYNKQDINWNLIMKQTKNILEEYPTWKYYTISYILSYMINISKIDIFNYEQGSILNLVPYYYQEAEKYFEESCEIVESAKNYEPPKQQTFSTTNTFKPKYKTIDISEV